LEIVVLDRQSDKLIRMEVQPKHTIGSIIETIVDKQKMDKSQRYKLTVGNQSFGKEDYLLKVKDAKINQGDHLLLEPETPILRPEREQVPPEAKIEEKQVETKAVDRVPKFCRQCGKPLRENAKFCLGCGAPIKKRTMAGS